MQKILVNNKSTTIEDFLNIFDSEDGYDYDNLGAVLDGDTLDKAIDSFENAYTMFELIEKYLQLAEKPIEVTI